MLQVKNSYGSFWSHIKFRKGWDAPLFARAEVEDLLTQAAEVVVRIRRHVDRHRDGMKLRAVGGMATEFLFTVEDHPQANPQRFVRQLVHATLHDANGYVEGLHAALVDGYLDQIRDHTPEEPQEQTRAKVESVWKQVKELYERLRVSDGQDGAAELERVARSLYTTEAALTALERARAATEPSKATAETASFQPPPTRGTQDCLFKISKVAEQVSKITGDVQELGQRVPQAAGMKPEDAAKVLDELSHKCLGFSEDLFQTLTTLDTMECSPEMKPKRKEQVVQIQKALDQVDQISDRLRDLRSSLRAQPAPVQQSAASSEEEDTEMVSEPESDVSLQEAWPRMRLHPEFRVVEQPKEYLVSSFIPGMQKEDLRLELSHDGSTFTVEGLRLPSEQEEEIMRRRVRLNNPNITPAEEAALILRAGSGRYGRFQQTYRVPADGDAGDIEASYDSGHLVVSVPKRRLRHRGRPAFYRDSDLWW